MTVRSQANKYQRDLLSNGVFATLLSFSVPTLGVSALQSLNGSINSIWVGHFLGETALAATLNGNMIHFLMMALIFGIGQAAMILVGKAFGANDLLEARRVIGTLIGSFTIAAIGISLIGFNISETILKVMSTPPHAAGLALIYLKMTFIGMPAGLLVTLLMMTLRGTGDSLSPLWFTLLSVGLDVVLNPILILGIGPLPALGIGGSALAMSLASFISLGAMIVWIYVRDIPIRLRGYEFRSLVPDLKLLQEFVMKGLPMGLQMIVMTIAATSILGLVNREGVLSTASYGVAQQIWVYMQMPAMAVAAGVSAMTAQAIGAGNMVRARSIAGAGSLLALAITLAVLAIALPLNAPIISVFIGANSQALPEARHILWVASWGYPLAAISTVLFAHARAYGVVMRPLLITLIAMFPLRLGFAFGAYTWLAKDALWLSVPLGMGATCLLALMLHLHLERSRRVIGLRPQMA